MEKHLTPKEKAEELIFKFKNSQDIYGYNDVRDIAAAKRCAIILVDELIKESCKGSNFKDHYYQDGEIQYWIEVKQEINK